MTGTIRRPAIVEVARGVGIGTLLFFMLVAILLFAGELASSKFLYVDF